MAKKAEPPPPNQNQSDSSDMIDKSISFDQRNMHGTWPFVKGCLMLAGGVAGFVFLSIYVFKNYKNWF